MKVHRAGGDQGYAAAFGEGMLLEAFGFGYRGVPAGTPDGDGEIDEVLRGFPRGSGYPSVWNDGPHSGDDVLLRDGGLEGTSRDGASGIALGLAQTLAAPATRAALRDLIRDPDSDRADRALVAALNAGAANSDRLAGCLVRSRELRTALVATVRTRDGHRVATGTFLAKYLSECGRDAGLHDLCETYLAREDDIWRLVASEDLAALDALRRELTAVSWYQRLLDPDGPGQPRYVWEKPKPCPVWLEVAAPAHGRVVCTGALARFFPAHTIHAERSTAVVAGNNCRLTMVDHYHVHRVDVPLDVLFEEGPVRQALCAAVERPGDAGRVDRLQEALRELATIPLPGTGRDRVLVRPDYELTAVDADGVQVADKARMRVDHRYVVEISELDLPAVLAEDGHLIRELVRAVGDPDSEARLGDFVRKLAGAVDGVADLDLIRGATDLPRQETLLDNLFGIATVIDAGAVMVGAGHRLTTDLRVNHPDLVRHDLRSRLDELRADVGPLSLPVRSLEVDPGLEAAPQKVCESASRSWGAAAEEPFHVVPPGDEVVASEPEVEPPVPCSESWLDDGWW